MTKLRDHDAMRPCRLCKTPTPHSGTKLCNGCWELESRIHGDPALSRKILDALEEWPPSRRLAAETLDEKGVDGWLVDESSQPHMAVWSTVKHESGINASVSRVDAAEPWDWCVYFTPSKPFVRPFAIDAAPTAADAMIAATIALTKARGTHGKV